MLIHDMLHVIKSLLFYEFGADGWIWLEICSKNVWVKGRRAMTPTAILSGGSSPHHYTLKSWQVCVPLVNKTYSIVILDI